MVDGLIAVALGVDRLAPLDRLLRHKFAWFIPPTAT
jgi:hypothetical protein